MREEEKQLDLFSESEDKYFVVELFIKLIKKVQFNKVIPVSKGMFKALKKRLLKS